MTKLKIVGYPIDKAETEKNIFTEELTEEESLIGRHSTCDIILSSPDVSRVHSRIFHRDGQYYFADLGSTGGSLVNDERAQTNQKFLLKPNDMIRIGNFVLIVKALETESLWESHPAFILPRMMVSHPYLATIVVGAIFIEVAISLSTYDVSLSSFSLPLDIDMDKTTIVRTNVDFWNKLREVVSQVILKVNSQFF